MRLTLRFLLGDASDEANVVVGVLGDATATDRVQAALTAAGRDLDVALCLACCKGDETVCLQRQVIPVPICFK